MIKPITFQGASNLNANIDALANENHVAMVRIASNQVFYINGYGQQADIDIGQNNKVKIDTGLIYYRGRYVEITEPEEINVSQLPTGKYYVILSLTSYAEQEKDMAEIKIVNYTTDLIKGDINSAESNVSVITSQAVMYDVTIKKDRTMTAGHHIIKMPSTAELIYNLDLKADINKNNIKNKVDKVSGKKLYNDDEIKAIANKIEDTRSDNHSPEWYMNNRYRVSDNEFKLSSVMGLSKHPFMYGTYCTVITYTPWASSSGGYPTQIAYDNTNNKIAQRVGTSNTAWSSWVAISGGRSVNPDNILNRSGEIDIVKTEAEYFKKIRYLKSGETFNTYNVSGSKNFSWAQGIKTGGVSNDTGAIMVNGGDLSWHFYNANGNINVNNLNMTDLSSSTLQSLGNGKNAYITNRKLLADVEKPIEMTFNAGADTISINFGSSNTILVEVTLDSSISLITLKRNANVLKTGNTSYRTSDSIYYNTVYYTISWNGDIATLTKIKSGFYEVFNGGEVNFNSRSHYGVVRAIRQPLLMN